MQTHPPNSTGWFGMSSKKAKTLPLADRMCWSFRDDRSSTASRPRCERGTKLTYEERICTVSEGPEEFQILRSAVKNAENGDHIWTLLVTFKIESCWLGLFVRRLTVVLLDCLMAVLSNLRMPPMTCCEARPGISNPADFP